jgi:hypothetical protein
VGESVDVDALVLTSAVDPVDPVDSDASVGDGAVVAFESGSV